MGYFSQRKKHERVNFSLNIILVVLVVLTLLSFFESAGRFADVASFWRFHYYIIALVAVVYALFSGFFVHAFLGALILVVNYVAIASSTNIFNNVDVDGENRVAIIFQSDVEQIAPLVKQALKYNVEMIGINHQLPLAYDANTPGEFRIFYKNAGLEKSFILTKTAPLHAGKLRLTPQRTASFLVFNEQGRHFIFINVDFSELGREEEKTVFDNLAEFILHRDEPVIVAGDFGIPAWSSTFKSFLSRTELEVKNHILMTDGNSRFNPFVIPSINVLAYQNFGLKQAEILPMIRGEHPFYFELNF